MWLLDLTSPRSPQHTHKHYKHTETTTTPHATTEQEVKGVQKVRAQGMQC